MFASLDRQETGKIVLSSLKDLLSTIKGNDVTKDVFEKVRQDLQVGTQQSVCHWLFKSEELILKLFFLWISPFSTEF